MLNQSILVGRIVKEPEVRETENGTKVTNITLAVQRPYKNVEGEYDTDFISCVLWKGIAETTAEYCKKGDLISLEGRIKTESYQNNEGKKVYNTYILCEKVRFLQTKKEKNDNLPKQEENVRNNEIEVNPFEEFANEIEINENDLPF